MSLKTLFCVSFALLVLSELASAIGPIECNRPNERYECGSACQTECATLGQPCAIVNIRCNDACYCIDGYARDSSGTCIPAKDCPSKTGGKQHSHEHKHEHKHEHNHEHQHDHHHD